MKNFDKTELNFRSGSQLAICRIIFIKVGKWLGQGNRRPDIPPAGGSGRRLICSCFVSKIFQGSPGFRNQEYDK